LPVLGKGRRRRREGGKRKRGEREIFISHYFSFLPVSSSPLLPFSLSQIPEVTNVT